MRAPLVTALLLLSALASAEPVIQPRDNGTIRTVVTEEGNINQAMGMRVIPASEGGDSVRWWKRREAGWRRWSQAKVKFPRAKSPTAEVYLSALAEGFTKTLPVMPRSRFHFYVADTLNPSLWPVGGGFFVVHAGLFRLIKDERQFAFLVALALAHEVLGHNMQPLRAGDVKWEPGSWRDGDFDGWPVEFWGFLVGRDPLARGGFAYTLQQESDALELVYRFFAANFWEYDGINRLVAELLPVLNVIPGSSSLAGLHPQLAAAVRLPHSRTPIAPAPVDSVVNRSAYARVLAEIERSPLQQYPWMLELVPYRDFVVERGINLDAIRNEYSEHAHVLSRKIEQAKKRSRNASFASEVEEFAARNEDLEQRDKVRSARIARTYLNGVLLLAHHRWHDAIRNAEQGLELEKRSEPFLWQRAFARQQLSQFNRCIAELDEPWRHFDHRRDLFIVQCQFLEGRFTDAAKLALEYRRKYPFDIEGAFWQMLAEVRLKRVLDKHILEIESFWGDRPMVRALKVFYFSYLGRHTDAQAAVDFVTDIPYEPQEWGMLEFAQSWMRQTFNAFPEEERADKLRQLAELQWPLASLVRYNLPREAPQRR